jgi:hypothetical protein
VTVGLTVLTILAKFTTGIEIKGRFAVILFRCVADQMYLKMVENGPANIEGMVCSHCSGR